ncbi:MAG: acetyl-CoA carboxylase biotin carboxyl carrier protein subunit [Planctomycetes bacterium]|nr:acetyl-CoA carboxylase biotin carboxyl carrier protein subunit [Planctomycetota bacterium]
MKHHVLIEGRHHEVEIVREGDGWSIRGAGQALHCDIGTLADGHAYSLVLGGRSIDVAVEERGGGELGLLIGGRRYAATVLGEREWIARSIKGDTHEGERAVRAVMTGIVREVLVQPGDAVQPGQTLFILEAMKMENEVKAGVAGKVARVTAAAGATVTQGDVIVEIA